MDRGLGSVLCAQWTSASTPVVPSGVLSHPAARVCCTVTVPDQGKVSSGGGRASDFEGSSAHGPGPCPQQLGPWRGVGTQQGSPHLSSPVACSPTFSPSPFSRVCPLTAELVRNLFQSRPPPQVSEQNAPLPRPSQSVPQNEESPDSFCNVSRWALHPRLQLLPLCMRVPSGPGSRSQPAGGPRSPRRFCRRL